MSTSDAAPRAHRATVYALVVAATVTGFLAVFAVWIQRQVLNGDNWTASSSRLLEDPAIRSQVSGYLVDQLYANVDVAGELRTRLPDQAKGLAGPAAGALRSVAGNVADEALQRPRVQAAWEQANRRAHARLMQVLNGGGDVLKTSGGAVTLDLTALLSTINDRAGVGGRLVDKVPPGAANLVIMRSNQLKTAQNVASALRPLAIGLTTLALALFALAVWLGRGWRREALRAAGIGLVVAGILALLARRLAGDQVVDALASTASVKPAIESAWRIETSLLASVAQATIAYGVVTVLAAWLAGPTSAAIATRRTLAPYLREPAYAYGGLAVLVLLLLVWAPTQALRQPVTALVLIGFLVAGFEVLRRQTAREFPHGERRLAVQAQTALRRLRRPARRDGGATPGGVVAPATTAGAAPGQPDALDRLDRVAALHERGVLTDDEFAAQKRAILAAAEPVSSTAGNAAG
jgi:hypothetical protein